MTKTIEFIKKEIENSKAFLDRAIRYNLTICVKNETEKLQTLEQIKCELEAWEVVKKHLILDKEFHRIDLHLYHDTIYKEDYLKLKKASEEYDE